MKRKPRSGYDYGEIVQEGAWVSPIKRGYRMICCDCGLVHRIDFDHVPKGRGRKVIFRAFRDEQATAIQRKRARRIKKVRK